MVVVAVNPADAQRLRVTLALLLAYLILLAGIDIGVVIEYGGTIAVVQQPLYNSRRTGRTAASQKDRSGSAAPGRMAYVLYPM